MEQRCQAQSRKRVQNQPRGARAPLGSATGLGSDPFQVAEPLGAHGEVAPHRCLAVNLTAPKKQGARDPRPAVDPTGREQGRPSWAAGPDGQAP